ncbi:MFS transporter [Saccharolobus solfataricus]|nr:MFS transporter [Saccharolobus solfataricus]AKA74903.1 MFS transporter [Saccharolobus solfataricus]AKA77599.1 MFS transporter [Saccharolobus solfataricus]AKA80290.1 MFS transporter [Saccharolobus solfataricus]AZF69369.1 MFS transporter [Saccharolobus solfataricus]AZF71989.1 MFS transporter [Saccharolobus solfataricus]
METRILPYWLLIFTIGFGWFSLAPLVPVLEYTFNVPLSSILFIISAYGYSMAILGLLAGFLSAKFTTRSVLLLSSLLSFIGLLGRAVSNGFGTFFLFAIIASLAYPLAVAPVGSIAKSVFKGNANTVVGISVGILFIGMALGSFISPSILSFIGLRGTLMLNAILALIAMILIIPSLRSYPAHYERSLKGSFNLGMVKNWYVGLAVASISVTLGSIASIVLQIHGIITLLAVSMGGFLTGLSFLGSGLGAIILPSLLENRLRLGLISVGLLTSLSAVITVLSLSFTINFPLIAIGYFLFGFFGNAYWSMAMASTTLYVNDPAKAGFATSMYSVITNVGVSVIPETVGVLFSNNSTIIEGVIIVVIIELIAGLLSFFLKS